MELVEKRTSWLGHHGYPKKSVQQYTLLIEFFILIRQDLYTCFIFQR